MSYINYSDDEMTRLFSDWDSIMELWDDRQARRLNDGQFQNIRQFCSHLIEISEAAHMQINRIEREGDAI